MMWRVIWQRLADRLRPCALLVRCSEREHGLTGCCSSGLWQWDDEQEVEGCQMEKSEGVRNQSLGGNQEHSGRVWEDEKCVCACEWEGWGVVRARQDVRGQWDQMICKCMEIVRTDGEDWWGTKGKKEGISRGEENWIPKNWTGRPAVF